MTELLIQLRDALITLKGLLVALLIAGTVSPILPQGDLILGGVTELSPYIETVAEFRTEKLSTLPEAGFNRTIISKDKPEVRLEKWNGEVGLTIAYNNPDINAKGKTNLLTPSKVEWRGAKQELHAYPLPAGEGMEDGGFEIEVVLKEKPATNKFDFQLSGYQDLDFFYQPALTQQEIDEGASRPENVIGSYAVYHKTKANHRVGSTNYATGKAFHIYRPKAIDANGVEEWAELSYENGVLSVTVPQSFLDKADYPARIDPTVGYTTDGASGSSFDNSSPNGNKKFVIFTAPEDGTIDSATFATRHEVNSPNTAKFKAAIYKVSDASLLSPQSAEQTTITWNGWTTATFTNGPSIVSGTNYYIAGFGIEGTGPTNPGMYIEFDTGASSNKFVNAVADAAWPDPHETLTATTVLYSLYATYQATGGAAPVSRRRAIIITED